MNFIAVLVSVAIIIGGQFAKYRYEQPKQKTKFWESNFFWSALYEIAIIFLGAILAIQLTEASEIKKEKKEALIVLNNIQEYVINLNDSNPFQYSKEPVDEEFDENTRKILSAITFDKCNTIENVLSQSTFQNTISDVTFIRLSRCVSNYKLLANELLTTSEPAFIYKQIAAEDSTLYSYINDEEDFLQDRLNWEQLWRGNFYGSGIKLSSDQKDPPIPPS